MINRYKNLLLASLAVLMIISCEENDDLLGFQEADNKITFPDHPAFSASFTTLDVVTMDVRSSGDAASLTVTGDGGDFGTVAMAGGAGTFTRTLAELGNPDSETLIFSDGETQKLLALSIGNPASFEETTSTEAKLDSTFSIVFSAETENGIIDSYDIFFKIGSESNYSATADNSNTNDALTLEDSLTFVAVNTTYDIGDSIYYKLEVSSGSLLDSISGFLVVTDVDLSESGTVTLRTPDYAISTGVTDSLRNAYNFKALKFISDEVLATDADSADIQLLLNAGELDLASGAGSSTMFVVADETFGFSSATYESVRDAYAAGIASATVSDIESLNTNAIILIQLGDIPQSGAPAADNRRYAAIQLGSIVKAGGGVTSEVTFDYKVQAQPE